MICIQRRVAGLKLTNMRQSYLVYNIFVGSKISKYLNPFLLSLLGWRHGVSRQYMALLLVVILRLLRLRCLRSVAASTPGLLGPVMRTANGVDELLPQVSLGTLTNGSISCREMLALYRLVTRKVEDGI